jgi:hypothetical protein
VGRDEVKVRPQKERVCSKSLPNPIFELQDRVRAKKGHEDFHLMLHHAGNHDIHRTLRIIFGTQTTVLNQILIQENSELTALDLVVDEVAKLIFFFIGIFLVIELFRIVNSHTEGDFILLGVIKVQVELVLV